MNKPKILPVDYVKPKEILEETQMSSWFGKDLNGKDVMIDESTLIDIIEDFFKSKTLLEHCRKYDWVVLPDNTRLVCSLKGAIEKDWQDIYLVLKGVIRNHNSKVAQLE